MKLPAVSQHALLRFIERGLHIDVASLRRQIARAAATGVRHGAGVVIFHGTKLVIVDGVVTTALPKHAVTSETREVDAARALRPVRRSGYRRRRQKL